MIFSIINYQGNGIKFQILFYICENGYYKNDNRYSGDEDERRIEFLFVGDKNVNYCGFMEVSTIYFQRVQYMYYVIQ